MKNLKIKFRGTRGSYPTPKANFLKFGGNTSCVEVHAGNHLIILDGGTGLIDLGRDLTREHILSGDNLFERKQINATIILSHIHQDHIQGIPFFNPLYINSTKINLMGLCAKGEDLKDTLSDVLFGKVFPLGLEDVSCEMTINGLSGKEIVILSDNENPKIEKAQNLANIKLKPDDVLISFHKTFAHPKAGSLCVKIQYNGKTLVYATDKESYEGGDKKFIQFAHGADLLIHDAQYTQDEYISPISSKQGFGHSTYQMAIENANLAHVKKLMFFHYDPNYDDDMLSMLEKEFCAQSFNYQFAKENLEIEL